MPEAPRSKGPLLPSGDGEVHFDRRPAGPAVAELVRHHWFVRWAVPEGRMLEQPVIEYPSGNLVIEAEAAGIYGPAPGMSVRRLEGTGWALGTLLQPAAPVLLADRPMPEFVGAVMELPGASEPVVGVRAAVPDRLDEAIAAIERWLEPLAARVDDEGRMLSAIVAAIETDPGLTRVDAVAARFALSERALQRLTRKRLGFSPKALIRRRRLQDAADLLARNEPVDTASLAAELGYADQAHLIRDFRTVTGRTPAEYRRAAAAAMRPPR